MSDDRAREALRERLAEVIGLCVCGHSIGGEHNSFGCYAKDYSRLHDPVRCDCKLTDDQDGVDALLPVVVAEKAAAERAGVRHALYLAGWLCGECDPLAGDCCEISPTVRAALADDREGGEQ